jgi:hypothetical protein
LKQKESLVAEVNDKGEVTVDGEFVGRLDGFRFRLDPVRGRGGEDAAGGGDRRAQRRSCR